MPILAMSAGTVTAVWGNAFIRQANGSLKPVKVGDKVVGGERIITEDDGIVQISPTKGPSVLVKAAAPETVNKAIAGIENQDPEQAPAAGLTGGAEGGMQPGLRVDRVVEGVGQLAFDFGTDRPAPAAPLASSADQRLLPASAPEQAQLSINDVSVNEGAGLVTFTVTLDRAATEPVTVNFATEADTAKDGDFSPRAGTVTFQPGETSRTIQIPITNDGSYEGSERFNVILSAPSGAALAKATGTATILDDGSGDQLPPDTQADDDRPVVVSVSGAKALEGEALAFHVKLSNDSTTDTPIAFKLSGVGAHPGQIGLDTGSVSVSFNGGPALPVTVDDDGNFSFTVPALTPVGTDIVVLVAAQPDAFAGEGQETVQLAAATVHNLVAETGLGTIVDATDLARVSIDDVTVNEAAGTATFTVTLAGGPASQAVSVNYHSVDGSAESGKDYESVTGTLTFAAGETSRTITVPIVNDVDNPVHEGADTFQIVLSDPSSHAVIARGTGTGTILDDGTGGGLPPSVLPDDDRPYLLVKEGEDATEGGYVVFNVVLTHPSYSPVTVSLALMSGVDDPDTPENESATVGEDTGTQLEWFNSAADVPQWEPVTGNLTFTPGQTLTQVRVATVDDQRTEDIEFIKLQATVVAGDTVNEVHANQTAITDNDAIPGIIEPIHAQVSALDTNLMIVLDTSGSMQSASGIEGMTRLQAAIKAIENLLDRYDQYGDVAVRLVTFASGTQVLGDGWVSISQAKSLLATLAADGSTNYDLALDAAKTAFAATAGKLGNAQNVSYFLSDGNPTLSSEYPTPGTSNQSGNVTQPNLGDGINQKEEGDWLAFLNQNHIKSYAIGMGGDVSKVYLDPIAYDGHADANSGGVVVARFSDLDGVLSGTAADFVTGNLSVNGHIGQPGGVFDHVASITVGSETYLYADHSGAPLTVTTDHGGTLVIDMRTGEYSYAAPSGAVTDTITETIGFTLETAQQQVASSTLDIKFDHTQVQTGTAEGDALVGRQTADMIMAGAGDDIVQADGGNDLLYGNAGDDELHGEAGNDVIVGGQGHDQLSGDAGSDVFVWHFSDQGASGSEADRAVDTIQDFDVSDRASGGDVLDLRDLLQGENTTGGTGNLDQFLHFDTSSGSDTVIRIAPTGSGSETQDIVLLHTNLRTDMGLDATAPDAQVIAALLQQGKLLVDHA